MRIRFFPLALSFLLVSTPALAFSARTLVAFGDNYSANGKTSVHRGVDVAMASGDQVDSPVAGKIKFAGRIPATGGGSTLAVTIDTGDENVTLLPLASVSLSPGQEVGVGDAIGTLAETGDASSEASHLHIGMKRGDLYVDPSALLMLPGEGGRGAEVQQPAGEPAGAPAADAAPDVAPAAQGAAPAVQVAPGLPQSIASANNSIVGEPAKPLSTSEDGDVASQQGASAAHAGLAAGVSLAADGELSGREAPTPVSHSGIAAPAPAATPLKSAVPAAGSSASHGVVAAAAGGLALAALVVVASVLVVRVAVRRRIAALPRMSDRFGILVAAPVDRW